MKTFLFSGAFFLGLVIFVLVYVPNVASLSLAAFNTALADKVWYLLAIVVLIMGGMWGISLSRRNFLQTVQLLERQGKTTVRTVEALDPLVGRR